MEHLQGFQQPDKAQWEQGLREAGSRSCLSQGTLELQEEGFPL